MVHKRLTDHMRYAYFIVVVALYLLMGCMDRTEEADPRSAIDAIEERVEVPNVTFLCHFDLRRNIQT